MSFHVVIPARLASTRLPGKVLREIAGRPMIEHVIRAAQASRADEVIVATDAASVARVAEAAGARAVETRADHSCGSDRLAEVARLERWDNTTCVVNVQADEPLMPPALIDQVGAALSDDPDAAIATAAGPITEIAVFNDPNVVKVVRNAAGRALYFSRAPIPCERDVPTASVPSLAMHHFGIYAYRVGALKRFSEEPPGALEQCESLEQLRAFELNLAITIVEARALPGPGVDTEADLAAVEARLKQT